MGKVSFSDFLPFSIILSFIRRYLFFQQILKREWPKNWQSFTPDIVGASKTDESMCQNNMVILKLLLEKCLISPQAR